MKKLLFAFIVTALVIWLVTELLPVSAQAPAFQTGNVNAVTDRSGSIATGGTSQQAAPQNLSRKRLVVENPCTTTSQGIGTTESLFFTFTSAAQTVGASIELAACGVWDSGAGPVSTEPVNVIAATTGHKFVMKEQ
jgi:hypothetical protein